MEKIELRLLPIDDDIAEADETYNLTIDILPSTKFDRVRVGDNVTATVTIYNDDSKQLYNNSNNMYVPVKW